MWLRVGICEGQPKGKHMEHCITNFAQCTNLGFRSRGLWGTMGKF